MRKQFLLLPGFLALLLFGACRKETSPAQQHPAHAEAIARVNGWLDARQAESNEPQSRTLQALRDKLELSALWFEELDHGEKLIIVPVKPGLETLYKTGKQPVNLLLLIRNEAGAIRKGNIVQYVADNGQAGIPPHTFFKFYNEEPLETDAVFSFLTLTGQLVYEIKYKDGKAYSFGIASPRAAGTAVTGPIPDPIGPPPVCIDWFLVTTYYYADGTTEQTEEYLYTTCESGGGGGGGSSSENEPELEELVGPAQIDWIVSESPTWRVWSIELLSGIKVPGEAAGGHFTSVSNKKTLLEGSNYNWTEGNANISIHPVTPQIAVSSVSGLVSANNGSWNQFVPSRHRIFVFSKVFK